jgi:hypothetical protein
MANIANNKFYMSWDSNYDINPIQEQIKKLFEDYLEGEISYIDINFMEGWFDSKWNFPIEYWENILKEEPIYFRCLTEEYGCSIVSMNIHNEDGTWREPQYFDL